MATNETPATGDRYWRVYGGPFVWWFGDNAGAGRVCESLQGGESKAACAESDFDLANEDDIKLTHAEARAILGEKWPATWPQGEAPATGQGGHTPEPWTAQPDPWPPTIRGVGDHCYVIADVTTPYTGEKHQRENRANAERIVACVNACAGMADPAATIRELREREQQLGDVKNKAEHLMHVMAQWLSRKKR